MHYWWLVTWLDLTWFRTSKIYEIRASAGNKRQRRGFIVPSKVIGLPSAGIQSNWFHTSLGCKPRLLIRFSLGWCQYSHMYGRAIQLLLIRQLAIQGVLTALVEVYWARRAQIPMPQTSWPYLRENHKFEAGNEEGNAVSTQENTSLREWNYGTCDTFIGSLDRSSRLHPQIANKLAAAKH
jgi:hypothetical protein